VLYAQHLADAYIFSARRASIHFACLKGLISY
jgi:hypothetical protein